MRRAATDRTTSEAAATRRLTPIRMMSFRACARICRPRRLRSPGISLWGPGSDPARLSDERRIMPPMTDLTLRRATAADEPVLAALADASQRLRAAVLAGAARHFRRRCPGDDRGGGQRRSGRRGADRRTRRRSRGVPSRPGGHRLLRPAPRPRLGASPPRRRPKAAALRAALMEHAEQWTAERGLPLLTLNMFAGNARARQVLRDRGVRGRDGEIRETSQLNSNSNSQGTFDNG